MPKHIQDKKPTERKKKVLHHLVANGGSMKDAMVKAGYSKAYAKNPKKFRETATWKELLDENLPDWLLTETHQQLLGSEDENIQLRATDLGYKIKSKFDPEVTEHIIRNYKDLSDEELERIYHDKTNTRKETADDTGTGSSG